MQKSFRRIVNICSIILLPVLLIITGLWMQSYALTSLLMVILALLPFFAAYEHRRPQPRELVPVAILAAVAALGRVIFAPLPQVKPTSAIVIIAGVALGPQAGFMTGALAALTSNFFFGQGPFTPWQMFAWGLMGFAAGFLGRRNLLNKRLPICVFGFVFSFIYGWITDIWQVVGFVRPITLPAVLLTFATSFYFDLTHAVSTVVFLLALALPWIRSLTRVRRKYGLLGEEEKL